MRVYNGPIISAKTYNGQTYSGVTGGSLAGDSASYSTVLSAIPSNFFRYAQFMVKPTQGISGIIGCYVVGGVGGATYVIAGRSNITAIGSYPVPLWLYGHSGTPTNMLVPRPDYVQFWNHAANVACFTATVTMAGEY